MRKVLLNPGPVNLSRAVREAAVREDLCHREPEFLDLQARVARRLLEVYGCSPEHWQAVALGGSGTAALEATVCSLLPAEARLLVLANGVYGERLARIALAHEIRHETLKFGWAEALELAEVRRALVDFGASHVAMVHHETTTGRLNPVSEIANICREAGVDLMLDAVSSFGAEEIPFGHPALLACAATGNKCLHGITGLAFVVARSAALAADLPVRSVYLHLPRWATSQAANSTPFTPPVNAYLALDAALGELNTQGQWRGRRERYRTLAGQIRRTLADLDVAPWMEPSESSCVLRSYRLPPDLTYNRVHDELKDRGFVIYAGQGGLAEEMFRISTMGEISDDDMRRLGAALAEVFA